MIKSAAAPTTPDQIVLSPMREGDLVRLHAWLQRAHVVEWWGPGDGASTLDEIRVKYMPSKGRNDAYIAWLGARPIGFAQSYVALGSGDEWWPDETDPGVRGIDQFLCDPHDIGHGLGTRLVTALVEHLFADPAVTRIQADPSPDNVRAIRCYAKAGFQVARQIVTPDGAAILMTRTRTGSETGDAKVELRANKVARG